MEQPIIKKTGKLFNIADFDSYSECYIETGTCYGQSLDRAIKADFYNFKSVEVYEPFYKACMEKFGVRGDVKLYFGKSYEQLPAMLNDNDSGTKQQNCVIFLDAHPAGPNTGGHDDLMLNGIASEYQQHSIIKKEIAAILAHRNDHVIIIDDQNPATSDEHLEYCRMLLAANPKYQFALYDEQLNKNGKHYENKILVCTPH